MLRVQQVFFSIKGTHILNGVNLNVNEGETLGIIGPNGSGKTTLFNCLSGFNIPDSGKIIFQGQEITAARSHRRAALGLGRVFQNFGVFREMKVIENIITALESRQPLWPILLPWFPQNRLNRKRALELLAEVGLQGRADEKAGSLSGGQMRLLEIIRTLAFGADLFLLDEPTAGVSPKMKEDVANLILKLQSMKKTVLVIEHDINFIQKFCDRIVVMNVGKIVLDDTPAAVRESELLQEIYLGRSENGNQRAAAALEPPKNEA
jgi:branched-chain amino acid transport system ATP-binding protein